MKQDNSGTIAIHEKKSLISIAYTKIQRTAFDTYYEKLSSK